MDWPYKYLGQRHRVLFHDSFNAVAIAQKYYPGDPDAAIAAILHIQIDEMCSADPSFKLMLEFLADDDRRRRRRTKTTKTGAKKQKQLSSSDEWERFLKFVKKMAEFRRIVGLS
jgi:hypothetical protein